MVMEEEGGGGTNAACRDNNPNVVLRNLFCPPTERWRFAKRKKKKRKRGKEGVVTHETKGVQKEVHEGGGR
jgi:hypothetical protein